MFSHSEGLGLHNTEYGHHRNLSKCSSKAGTLKPCNSARETWSLGWWAVVFRVWRQSEPCQCLMLLVGSVGMIGKGRLPVVGELLGCLQWLHELHASWINRCIGAFLTSTLSWKGLRKQVWPSYTVGSSGSLKTWASWTGQDKSEGGTR